MKNENEVRLKTCCFSGHRPQNMPWGYNETGLRFWIFKRKLKKAIEKNINDGYHNFICGMALGADMLFAETVISLKEKYPDISLECALPCINQPAKWSYDSNVRYYNIIKKADKVTYVSKREYHKGCMEKRNKYMVSNSNKLIAAYNGKEFGGTVQTLSYAMEENLTIEIIRP